MPKHVAKPFDEHRAFVVSEGVEQPAVDHRVELAARVSAIPGVADDEMGVNASLGSFGLGLLDSDRYEVESQTSWPLGARNRRFSPVPQPTSRTLPPIWPFSANFTIAGCGRPVSPGAWP